MGRTVSLVARRKEDQPMDDINGICMKPIGIVRSGYQNPEQVPIPGKPAEIEIFPEYGPALLRIGENSHLWILLWFHRANRKVLTTSPRRIAPEMAEFGVFGLRTPNHPNPIALTLVKLESVEGNVLKVKGMDAIDGTGVLDIKPYFEQDTVFSPVTPYIRASDYQMRRDLFLKIVVNHHLEECAGAYMAVRMALAAESKLGQLTSPDIRVQVEGSPCLGDSLQALSRGRLSNPPRFRFKEELNLERSLWEKQGCKLVITARRDIDQAAFTDLHDEDLLIIETVDC